MPSPSSELITNPILNEQEPTCFTRAVSHPEWRAAMGQEFNALMENGVVPTTIAELYWLQMLLLELHVSLSSSPILWCDNIGAIALASNLVFHARTKHVEVDYHFIIEKVMNKDIQVRYISTQDQVANVFTKGQIAMRFNYLRSKLLVTLSPSICGWVLRVSDTCPSLSALSSFNCNIKLLYNTFNRNASLISLCLCVLHSMINSIQL
ncbi:hypothetical protein AAG906_032439 [Vitis piasezkii]